MLYSAIGAKELLPCSGGEHPLLHVDAITPPCSGSAMWPQQIQVFCFALFCFAFCAVQDSL